MKPVTTWKEMGDMEAIIRKSERDIMKRAVLAEIVDMLVEEHLKPTVYDELKRRIEAIP